MRNETRAVHTNPRLLLEDGADECTAGNLQMEDRGVTFESSWKFPAMSELTVCFAWNHHRLGLRRTPLQGVVLESQQTGRARYRTTVLFLDLPEEHKEDVREIARLATVG